MRLDTITTTNGTVDLTQANFEQLMFEFKVQSVYGASKREQSVVESPSSVTIVDAEDIKQYGYRNFAEILGRARGFYTSYDRNCTLPGSCGFNQPGDWLTKFLVLVDGHRVNDNVLDGALVGNDVLTDDASVQGSKFTLKLAFANDRRRA